jgi:hypothetical protein
MHEIKVETIISYPSTPTNRSPGVAKNEPYHPLSPPPSDHPIPPVQEREDDLHMEVDIDAIGRLYPGMKAAWREVRSTRPVNVSGAD